MTKFTRSILANIGPDEPWPDVLMIKGEPHIHIITMFSPIEVQMEVMGKEYPTPEAFMEWHRRFKESFANCEYYMTRYRNTAGEVIWVRRFPETMTCRGCGDTLTAEEPSPKDKASGVETIFICKKCQTETHRMTREWSEKHGFNRRKKGNE